MRLVILEEEFCGGVLWSECLYLPKIHVWKPKLQSDNIRSGAFVTSFSVFVKEAPRDPLPFLPRADTTRCLQPGQKSSPEPDYASTPILDFQPPEV